MSGNGQFLSIAIQNKATSLHLLQRAIKVTVLGGTKKVLDGRMYV
jgi:hypothetical protein